ncbi:autotransporter domain-containing protein [Chlamydia vaughanii]|uniref:autotransporter domain-containing protein n=1 Tax=Chlamydia vaughanii TaxID=3112552 RepID=UPI0032B17103
MPLSLKSSSFCFLACLCSSGLVYAQQPLNHSKAVLPFFNVGEDFFLTSNLTFNDVHGAQFASSFLGSSTNFSILGQKHNLAFSRCYAPIKDGMALISATDKLTLTGLSKLILDENISTGKNGLISGKNTSVTNCRNLIFSNNKTIFSPVTNNSTPPPTTTTVNCFFGSIFHTDVQLDITNNSKQITFDRNSANFGSAIVNQPTTTCNISNNSAAITFSQNFATCAGGAIYDGTITFARNTGPITFSGNTAADGLGTVTPNPDVVIAAGSGGALCSPTKTVMFDNNTAPVVFSYNLAEKSGGAIYATVCNLNTISNMTFVKNSAKENGGAICAKDLTIHAAGETTFYNNRAKKGGAIYTGSDVGHKTDPAGSILTITSGGGNMTFLGNMIDSRPGVRNAIQLEGNAKIAAISASGCSKILFYDPIVNTGNTNFTTKPAADIISINTAEFSGSVVFSAHTLTLSEKLNPANSTSSLFGHAIVGNGQLVVTNNATLNVLGLTADTGRLTVGSGGTVGLLTTPTTITNAPDPIDFTIKNLGFDVISYLNPNWSVANVNSGTKTITLEGSLALVSDNDTDLYDNPLLLSSLSIPVATFTSNNTAPTKTNFTAGDIPVSDHFGYQGVWSSSWTTPLLAPTPSGGIPQGTTDRTLYVAWRPNPTYRAPYILDPSRRGDLVSNTLWTSFLATQAFSDALTENRLCEHEGLVISAKALGNYIQHRSRGQYDGFAGRYGGYQATIGIHYPDDASLGLAFGQLYGQVKSRRYDAKSTEQMTLVGLFGGFPLATQNNEIKISWEATYGYTVNRMKTKYPQPHLQPTRKSKGNWHNNTYYASLSVDHPFLTWCKLTRSIADNFELNGFISAEFMGGWQNAFTEKGDLARSFSRGRGHNISLPIGFSTELHTPFKKAPSTITLKLAYKPDVYRVNPHNIMTIMTNKESFSVEGARLARNGFYLQMHDSLELSDRTTGYFDYVFDSKRALANHRIATGLQSKF